MATFKFRQRTREDRQGNASLILRAFHGRKKKDFTLKLRPKAGSFDNVTGGFRKGVQGTRPVELKMMKLMELCYQLEQELQASDSFTLEEFGRRFKNIGSKDAGAPSLEEFYDELMKGMSKSPGNAKIYRNTIQMVKRYNESPKGSKILRFEDLTHGNLGDLLRWMDSSTSSGPRTRELRITNLKSAYNKAVRRGHVSSSRKDPFENLDKAFFTKKEKIKGHDYLTLEEWDRFKKFGSPTIVRGKDVDSLAWDMFRFSVFCRGINMADMVRLRKENINREGDTISYVRKKTGKIVRTYIRDEMREIMGRYEPAFDYLLPLCNRQNPGEQYLHNLSRRKARDFNKAYRRIGPKLNIESNFTFYSARHTFATLLHLQGASVSVISDSMGHSTEKETQTYLRNLDVLKVHDIIKDML